MSGTKAKKLYLNLEVAMYYIQDNNDFIIKYTNGKFEYTFESLSGDRVQLKNGTIKIKTCKSTTTNNYGFFILNDNDIYTLKIFLENIFKKLKSLKTSFSAYLKMHSETILIDEKKDFRVYGFIKIIMNINNKNFSSEFAITRDLKLLFDQISTYICYFEKIIRKKFLTAKPFFRTNYPVILSAQAAGCFIHEIIGHLLEEDFFCFNKKLFENYNIPKKIEIVDDITGYEHFIGLNKFDDRGTKIKPLKLISAGKITNIMAINKKSSFDRKLYGFARRENFKTISLPRMRFTKIKTVNNYAQNDIIARYKNALFMSKIRSAYTTFNSDKYVLSGEGFIVKNGEIKNFVSSLIINGNVLTDLKYLDFIGNDPQITVSFCGKLNQLVRVGVLAPTISLSKIPILQGNLHE